MIADEIARLRDHLSKRQRENGCYQVRTPNPKKPERRKYDHDHYLKNRDKKIKAAMDRYWRIKDEQAQRT
jgi:hypothetical protein